MCVVLPCYFPYKVYIDSNLHDTLDMGEAYSLCPNIEVLFHYVHMGFMVMFNYDYLLVS
jgi:hypothetical protein